MYQSTTDRALASEYDERVKMFQEFVEAFMRWASKERPSQLSFEEGNESEVVTFSYLGEKLRIRHLFKPNAEERSSILRCEKPQDAVSAVWSKLDLLEAKDHPQEDVWLASLDFKRDGKVTLPASEFDDPLAAAARRVH